MVALHWGELATGSHCRRTDKRHYSLECAGQAALWSAATCRSFRALRGFVSECGRQAAADQSGARPGPRRGSRAGVLTPPHSREFYRLSKINIPAMMPSTAKPVVTVEETLTLSNGKSPVRINHRPSKSIPRFLPAKLLVSAISFSFFCSANQCE